MFLLLTPLARAQTPNFQQMSPEERQAFLARMRAIAEEDRRHMMALVGVSEPTGFPPEAEDPRRPAGLSQREGSNNWYDEPGNTHVRSGWGSWS
ncbi:MAG TPA: hypothetical protein VF190_11060, partial [Rhodothermales bacterium]